MRARAELQPPMASAQAAAPADRAAPLQEITFDISEFLGDNEPANQLLQNLMEAPSASVPAVVPPPAPAAAAGSSASATAGCTGQAKASVPRRELEQARRFMSMVPLPPVWALPPGVSQGAAMRQVFLYLVAQKRTKNDNNILLHKLAKKNNDAELARFADLMIGFRHKTHVHTKNRYGETPLHVVTGAASARVLLKRGARLDAVDKLGNTPIHLAAHHQRVEVLAALLECGPDYSLLDRKNLEGYTALHLVVIHQPLADPHRRALQLLIENSVDVNVADDTGGRSALFHAVLRGDELAVRELVENNAAVNMGDFSETTPLQAAEDVLPADDNHICSILLERGGFKVPPADRVTQSGRRGGARRKAV